jgi:DNA-binding transcriptional LysR family regulator
MHLNFRTLDLNLLRVFDAVMAEGSLTRAAESLAMTQPAVSHAVKRLRTSLGEDLFVRTAFGMRPTPRAQQLWPQVREALVALRQALAPDDFDPARDPVNFRLAMADATAVQISPGLVEAIERGASVVTMQVLPLTTRDPRRLLDAGEIDLAVGYFPAAVTAIVSAGAESPLRHVRLYATRYVCAMRKGHPLADKALTIDDYCAAHHLMVSFSGRPHGYVDQALAAHGRHRRIVLTVNQFFTAGRVVAQSDLLTVLPESLLDATGYRDELVVREVPVELAPVHVEMLWHRRHEADPAQRWLRKQVQAAAEGAAASVKR